MKNSADIRMALDALTDIYAHPHLTHVVIVSSDSDFISLSQKIKQAGRFVAGIGISGFSNRFWISSCNEFKFYQNLTDQPEPNPKIGLSSSPEPSEANQSVALVDLPESTGSLSFAEAKEALHRAAKQVVERKGENYVPSSTVKVVLKRLLPSFDERALGFQNFTEFVVHCVDVVQIVDSESGGHLALTNHLVSSAGRPFESAEPKPSRDDAGAHGGRILEGITPLSYPTSENSLNSLTEHEHGQTHRLPF